MTYHCGAKKNKKKIKRGLWWPGEELLIYETAFLSLLRDLEGGGGGGGGGGAYPHPVYSARDKKSDFRRY